jgi:hypothetical protein
VTPLQKIAMGLVIVLLPAYFPAHAHPEWKVYDALPDPIGWVLVVAGVWALARSTDLELGLVKYLAVAALVVSVPLWFPQLNHLLVPKYNPGAEVSGQWFLSLPQTLFGLALARQVGRAGEFRAPRDPYVAGRFGVLTWGFAALVVLPVVAYGGGVDGLVNPTLVLVGLVNLALIFYLFMVNRRTWLGGPGPRDWAAEVRARTDARTDTDGRHADADRRKLPPTD